MKFRISILPAALAVLVFCVAGWAVPATDGPSAVKTAKTPKQRHWTGTLVDIGCMTKTLGAEGMNEPTRSLLGGPHLFGWGAGLPQKTSDHAPDQNALSPDQEAFVAPQQQPPGQQGTMPSAAPRSPEPQPGTLPPVPDPSAAEQARATRVNDAAKVCAATGSTESIGLATGEGQVFQFDHTGNLKAQEALKTADAPPGKRIKAKVTGTLQSESTVLVASIEIKAGAWNQAIWKNLNTGV